MEITEEIRQAVMDDMFSKPGQIIAMSNESKVYGVWIPETQHFPRGLWASDTHAIVYHSASRAVIAAQAYNLGNGQVREIGPDGKPVE